MKYDLNSLAERCRQSRRNSETLETFLPQFIAALDAHEEDVYSAHFYPDQAQIIAHLKTREAFAPIRALHAGKWAKSEWPADAGKDEQPMMCYEAVVAGVRLVINVSELPPYCRIETKEVVVAAHVEMRRKIVCNSPELQPA